MNKILKLCILLFGLVFACQPKGTNIKELTEFFFLEDSAIFRHVNLGMKMSEIKKTESKNPTFEDEGGLLYEFKLENGRNIELSYTCVPTDSSQVLSAINVTITSTNESDAISVYSSLEQTFHKRYGVSDGSSGQLVWQVPNIQNTKTSEIHLKLQKKEILFSLSQF